MVNSRIASVAQPLAPEYDRIARRIVDEHGLGATDGVVRVSMVHYNTLAEVDRLIAALEPNL